MRNRVDWFNTPMGILPTHLNGSWALIGTQFQRIADREYNGCVLAYNVLHMYVYVNPFPLC